MAFTGSLVSDALCVCVRLHYLQRENAALKAENDTLKRKVAEQQRMLSDLGM